MIAKMRFRPLVALLILAAMLFNACAPKEQKKLVLYYSQTGTTKTVATEIASQLNADIEALDITQPYSGTYDQTIQRCRKEQEAGTLPTLNPIKADLASYDTIFLGFPIWFGTYAPPVAALLQNVNLEGKTIIPFCTFGSGGLEASSKDLKQALPSSSILEGYGIRTARINAAKAEVERFLILGGFKEGEATPYPDFSEQAPVDDPLLAVFHAACDGYKYPLGEPLTAGQRETPMGTEFLFTVQSQNRNGQPVTAQIYILATNDDADPVFTRVVR